MRIVVLDGFAANPGDISWSELNALGEVTRYDRTKEDEIVSRARDAEAIFTNKCAITADILEALPRLKYIGVLATGYNIVDTAAAKARGVAVTNIPAYSTLSVAQHVFALMLEIASHVGAHSDAVKAGRWQNSRDFCFWDYPLTEIAGKSLGIVGYGAIGQAVGRIAKAFEMRVNAYSPSKCEKSRLDEIIENSDIISLNCPLTKDNARMIDRTALSRMKKGAWLINTARGGLIDEADVAEALAAGRLGAYAADVVTKEPIRADNPLLSSPNTILTPHIAWAPYEARVRLMRIACANLRDFINGTNTNQVNV